MCGIYFLFYFNNCLFVLEHNHMHCFPLVCEHDALPHKQLGLMDWAGVLDDIVCGNGWVSCKNCFHERLVRVEAGRGAGVCSFVCDR